MSFSDLVDHLAALSKSISASADTFPTSDGLFTTAVLKTALGDLIRDIDSSELGLFTLVHPPAHVPTTDSDARRVISRVQFPGATPLRKPPSRRQEFVKPKEYEPEVYAQAALKYLDRYHSIRPMPRARSKVLAIIGQLEETRRNIQTLSDTLQQLTSANPATSGSTPPESSAADEEQRIQSLQTYLAELRKQKDDFLRTSNPPRQPKPPPKLIRASSPLTLPETQEVMFWNASSTSARTLHFTDKLMDEEVDINDVSVMSFTSPVPRTRSMLASLGLYVNEDSIDNGGHDIYSGDPVVPDPPDEEELPHKGDEPEVDDGDAEQTVILKKLPPSSPPNPTPPKTTAPRETPSPGLQIPAAAPPESAKKPKMRMNAEIEKIVAKIWSTVGEIIAVDYPVDPTGRNIPPRAKETIAHLESLSSQTPSQNSPTASSLSSLAPSATSGQPTSQQIATGLLLHALLTQPGCSMSLNKLKEVLVGGGRGSIGTRALYACVAKKLIKIERGGGEQVVKFDV